MTKRFWEIDFVKGIIVLLMIIFNYAFALKYLGVYELNAGWEFWWLFPRIIGGGFVLLSGISLAASYNEGKEFFHYLRRGAVIFGLALLITIGSWLFIKENFIVFGILHFMALAGIMAYPFLKNKISNAMLLVLAILCVVAGAWFASISASDNSLVILGLRTDLFASVDYFPLFPWFGITLLGLVVGKKLYENGKRKTKLVVSDDVENQIVKLFSFIGKNSLAIYFLHQPVLVLVLILFAGAKIVF